MGESKWTDEQQKVIDTRGRSILVSAAAGSGKTAVLVERIIHMIAYDEHPLDIDRLLVVTFTKAAAAEMRQRISDAIEKELSARPDNAHLQLQSTLVHNAKIMTIDSFCVNVVRNHFHKIGIEPGFRVADENELKLIKEDVINEVLDKYYEEKTPEFMDLVNGYSSAKSDERVKDMILSLHRYSQSAPWPMEWLDSCVAQYECETYEELLGKEWAKGIYDECISVIKELIVDHRRLLKIASEPDGPGKYIDALESDIDYFETLVKSRDLFALNLGLKAKDFAKLGTVRKGECDEQKQKTVKDGRDKAKKQIEKLIKTYFGYSEEEQLEYMHSAGKIVKALICVTKTFTEAYMAEKARRNVVDFSDVEHFALDIFRDKTTADKVITDVAREYAAQFDEIMVDEYQDSNYVQEAILTAITRDDKTNQNMFMVGDVKQSIYRFRLSNPQLFVDKYARYSKGDSDKHLSIDLFKNFRSRSQVLDTVNDIFYHLMAEDIGNVDYDDAAALYVGGDFEPLKSEHEADPEIILVNAEELEEDKETAEARAIAGRIREMVADGELGVNYKDIVILLRAVSTRAEVFSRVFAQMEIPLVIEQNTGYFVAPEVQVILSLLRIIDNPLQDIPLAAVMKSKIGGFTSEELALIKASDDAGFNQCVFGYGIGEGDWNEVLAAKVEAFRKMLCDFRYKASFMPVHSLIQDILETTGFLNYVTALPTGKIRRANLQMLVEKAISYEQTSYQGLFHFIRYMDKLIKYDIDFGEAEVVSDQQNAVRLMTIHKSKGLQFPVVFVGGMGRKFNETDLSEDMIMNADFGIGLKWKDSEKRFKADTLIRNVFQIEAKKENLGEEMRVLYVALTRAVHKIVMVGVYNAEDTFYRPLDKHEKLSYTGRYGSHCYFDWVIPALLGCGDKYNDIIGIYGALEEQELIDRMKLNACIDKMAVMAKLNDVDESLVEDIAKAMEWKYPYAMDDAKRPKVSVSEVKHRQIEAYKETVEEDYTLNLFEGLTPAADKEQTPPAKKDAYIPDFIQAREEEVNAGALRGTAVHRFMQCFEFAKLDEKLASNTLPAKKFTANLIQEICDAKLMKEEDAKLINTYTLFQFLISEEAHRMCLADKKGMLFKELPFVMKEKAKLVWEESGDNATVLIQGIIDAFWFEDDEIVLLDYKTDNVDSEGPLLGMYSDQLNLYADALTRHYGMNVKEKILYSLKLNKGVQVK